MIALQRHRDRVTDTPVPLIAVNRAGNSTGRPDAVSGQEELLEAGEPG